MPRLSVIFLSLDGGFSVKRVVRQLSLDPWASQLEIVLAIDEDVPVAMEQPSGFAGIRIVRAPVRNSLGIARAAAIRAASAPFIVLGEDHSFPVPGWAQVLVEALEGGASAVGPQIQVANPGTSISWCDAILCYGPYLRPVEKSVTHLPWHNSAYRRDALLAFGERLEFLLQADSLFQRALALQGHPFVMAAEAAVQHCNHSLLGPQLRSLYWGSRLYGATRASHEEWSVLRRFGFAAALPAIFLLRTWRALRICWDLPSEDKRYLTLLPLLLLGATVAATGEVWGYLFGLGQETIRQRSFYELSRVKHVRASEVCLFQD